MGTSPDSGRRRGSNRNLRDSVTALAPRWRNNNLSGAPASRLFRRRPLWNVNSTSPTAAPPLAQIYY